MKDATLAAIAIELGRLREQLATVDRAAVLLLVGGKVYLSVKARSADDARAYLGAGLLEAFERGGLLDDEAPGS